MAIVGGGSTYTPELVEGLCDHQDRLVVDELVLLDPDPSRLEPVGGLAERILRQRGWGGRLVATDDRHRALDGADFVVVQLRVGGQTARLSDETLPLGHGCFGQETTGPGGLAKALRTVPLVLELAEETASRAAPGAWLVDFTNPVGIVTQALADEGHRAIGLCNVARWVQRRLAHYLGGADPDAIDLEHVGLNHLTWVRSATVDGVDRLPELLDRFGPELELEMRLSAAPDRAAGGAALLLPPLLLRPRRRAGRAAGPRLSPPGRGGGRAGDRAAGAVRRSHPGHQARGPLAAGRGVLLGGGRPPDGLPPRRDR